ncbi:MAG: putative DNA-binding domain-containing protein [Myxococcales bacterium]|nr:putative DNA-binding domain-containing protein [Myxococcales bacterium]
MNLRELQLSVAEALLDSRQKLGLDHALCAFVESTDRPAPHERLRLCRRAVIATLTDALERVYPACRALVEAEYFSSAARRYAFGTPAVSAERNDYGDRFADHLEMLPSIESMPYLPDLARLEWLWHRAANAAEDDPLTLDELLHIDFERRGRLRFSFRSSVGLLLSPYSVDTIFAAFLAQRPVPRLAATEGEPVRMVVWRNDALHIDRLNADEWRLMQGIGRHRTMAQISEPLDPDTAVDTLASLPRLIARELLVDFEMAESN